MRKYLLTWAAALCLLLSLAACGGEEAPAGDQTPTEDQMEETAAPMTTEEYQAEVEAANTAIGEAMLALSNLSATDEASLQEGLTSMRAIAEPLRELAAIENPPEEYTEAHAQLASGCTLFADAMDGLCDSAEALMAGEMTAEEYNTAGTDYMTDLTEAATQITNAFALMEQ